MCRSNTAAGNPGKSLQQSPWAGSRKWVGFQRGSTPRHSVFAWSTPNVTPRSDCKARPTEPYSRSSPPNPTNTSGPITRAAAHPTSPNLPRPHIDPNGKVATPPQKALPPPPPPQPPQPPPPKPPRGNPPT